MKIFSLWLCYCNLVIILLDSITFAQGQIQRGLFPELINLAASSEISANATCGEYQQEIYCKPLHHGREPQCSVCDARSPDQNRRHGPQNAIDGTPSWWQSPSLEHGWENQFVTITIDLKQIYQVEHIIVKSGISPRPGNWVLEKSVEGVAYQPWQFYAMTESDCASVYGLPSSPGRPTFHEDEEVVCTTQFSRLNPVEGGEIHTSLVNGRPGSSGPSDALLRFTEARYIRLRLQKIQSFPGDLLQGSELRDTSVSRRYYYTIKDISIGGRCICNGHADSCSISSGSQICSCAHNTCGEQCNQCCPMFNQYPWRKGNSDDGRPCEKCNCHGHATACRYDPQIARARLSKNLRGESDGGGVCINCQENTAGVNCEKCKKGYYRPQGARAEDPNPCVPCSCSGVGVTPSCVSDDSQISLGLKPGNCLCKDGFTGPDCSECAPGYRNYPQCEQCPCSRAGSKNKVCEGHCICKDNVEGIGCDQCVPGTFHLDEYNPVGCTECFCHGVTDQCGAARLPVYLISEKGNWKVSDLQRTKIVEVKKSGFSVFVEKEQMTGFKAYYWLAPQAYLGNRMTSYGQTIRIKTSWKTLRGDTSGRATRCPEIIIEGAGYRIAYGGKYFPDVNSLLLNVPLYEQEWYHFPKDIPDIGIDQPISEYNLGKVSRREMMEILQSMSSLMIRARFSTVQAQSSLHDVLLEYGQEGGDMSTATLLTKAVERCRCPPGYTGLSCGQCLPGYRRLGNAFGGQCLPCECHGHVKTCDAATGACGECQHNTVGPNCERCAEGYYGDAAIGTPEDCKQCKCPLSISQNHFTPQCREDSSALSGNFKCICPVGYEGERCQQCVDGYFGNPMMPGNYCQPCDCNGNVDPRQRGWCDKRTGECLKCLGNTAGWNCERCKENHYGDPLRGQCFECGCHPIGSNSMTCNPSTGQCPCKQHYAGRQCEYCEAGRGGIKKSCPLCRCSRKGSISDICDPVSGKCPCKPGVGGRQCGQCLPDHFGDLVNGCSRCNCDKDGSTSSTCDIVTGQCKCKSNVVGRMCSSCKPGYWGLSAGLDCRKCNCNPVGTEGGRCDDLTGQCKCRPGVGGDGCDRCLPGYWGYSPQGCRPCDPCDHPGKNCDPNSGRCVCPSNTEGDRCERCKQGFWDYSADIGCRPCSCSGPGSLERQCDPRNGRCICREGFEGPQCNRCSVWHYGYPNCRPCNCNRPGLDLTRCRNGHCQCDENGQCPCKINVEGLSCNQCADGTFGLNEDNPLGCFKCFCFKKSNRCQQAPLTWTQLALPGERTLGLSQTETKLNITNQLYIIPEYYGDVTIGTSLAFLAPLYWQLPLEFMRDKTMSYNGYLKFRTETVTKQRQTFPEQILQSYPLVSLQGNWRLVLEHFPETISPDGRYSVRLHEAFWRKKNDPSPVTREEMMIALQNIQHILIRATSSDEFSSSTLSEVTLDIAAEGTPVSSRKAIGVEQCICPESYSGLSCQNPNIGFYRWFKENYIQSTIVIDLVGESKPCHCNGRADKCHQETGVCLNCRDNTAGPHCEYCASGFYGDPNKGLCQPCACPSRQQNFAETCQADPVAGYICHCKQGYTGNKCERCADGYYGSPTERGGSCKPCRCDPNGSLGIRCNSDGYCKCKPGITGQKCSQCEPIHVVAANGCISCVDGCVDVLLDEIEDMIAQITNFDVTGVLVAPWSSLRDIENVTRILRDQLNQYESRVDVSQAMLLDFDLDFTARVLLQRVQKLEKTAEENLPETEKVKKEGQEIYNLIIGLRALLDDAISTLENYAIGETSGVLIGPALDEAELLLRQIKARNFDIYDRKAAFELKRSIELLTEIRLMLRDNSKVDDLARRVKEMTDKIKDLMKRMEQANERTARAQQIDAAILKKIIRLKSNLDGIISTNVYTEDRNFNSTRFVRRARRKLDNTYNNFEIMVELLRELKNQTSLLAEFESKIWRMNSDYRGKYVKPAEAHALHLKAQAIKLENLFKQTRDVADGPLRAAEAYQRIVDAIMSAEEAAKNALEAATKAYEAAYPGNPEESLVRRSKLSIEKSRDLRNKGDTLRITIIRLAKDLERQRLGLERTEDIIEDSKLKLAAIEAIVQKLSLSGISQDILKTLDEIIRIDADTDKTLFHVESLYANLTLMREYTSQIGTYDSSLIKEIEENISFVKGATMKGERLGDNLRNQANRIEVVGNNLRDRIEALKRKIKQTRQHATSIRVSLTTDENGVCTRKYKRFLQPSTTNRLTLGYAINSRERDAMLLFMGGVNSSDFMVVEMVNRRIHFTWDAGKGPQTIVHPIRLETNNEQVSDATRWYHITINRIGNIGELQVRPAVTKTDFRKKLYEHVSDASPAGFTRMDFHTSNYIWVGGVPREYVRKVQTRNFAGCLHYITIDGEPLGLWNFTESIGCSACNEGFDLEVKVEDKTAYSFNGKGYFKGTNILRRPKPFYSVVLRFRSLDEDALLFLAVNEQKNQYFSLTLIDGRVQFVVKFDEQAKLVLRSEKKLNNLRELIQIQAIVSNSARGGERSSRLVVGAQDQLATIKGGPDLDLQNVPFYFGGVEPEFNRDRWGKEVELRSLLGCMGYLSVMEIGKNPHTDGQFYGIDVSCPHKPLNNIGFVGQGFLEMPSKVLRKDSNFGFTFKTMSPDALLMVSTFKGQPLRGAYSHPPDYYSVSLVRGKLDLRLFAGSSHYKLISRHRYNDGKLHSFFVTKENRRVQLYVDDQMVNSTRLERGRQQVKAPDLGGLYLGGAPREISVDNMVGSSAPFRGCVQDVIINNEILSFNEPIRFDDAFIGRCSDLPKSLMEGMEGDMKKIMSCLPPKQHSVEYGALKFGDQSESHVIIPIPRSILRLDFKLSFEFRTYYPSGLFFLAYNKLAHGEHIRKLDLLSAYLNNGRLVISSFRKGKETEIVSPISSLNSGEWRKVAINKYHRKVSVYIDDKLINSDRISKKNNFGTEIFLGSHPSSLTIDNTDIPTYEPFKGCLRNLRINNEKYEVPNISRQDHIAGVGQCFATVQPGSFFPGDAYAVYEDKFQVGPVLELRLEFRTWELNGVLMSVSNPNSSVALSLELTNGAILLSVNVGHQRPFSARVSIPNRYEFCDNQWHTVFAHYIKDSLTLRVDEHQSYGFNGLYDLKKVITEAPLYIGGLPDKAPYGTLYGTENFQGCIRNIVLNSRIRDWTDMHKLNNVFLNACPVS